MMFEDRRTAILNRMENAKKRKVELMEEQEKLDSDLATLDKLEQAISHPFFFTYAKKKQSDHSKKIINTNANKKAPNEVIAPPIENHKLLLLFFPALTNEMI